MTIQFLPRRAMVLAAGRGERLRPITDTLPKPLVAVGGRTMLDRALDRLAEAGVERAVVNLHHLGGMIAEHLFDRAAPTIEFSREPELLDTGGGIRNALGRLGPDPFYAVNADVVWLDGRRPGLGRMARAWDDERMDVLLLLHSTARAVGYRGRGDFILDPAGRVRRRQEREVAPFVFTGVQILHPRLFDRAPEGAFSMNLLFDRALETGRIAGIAHDGEWYHVGTPDAVAEAEAHLGEDARSHRDLYV